MQETSFHLLGMVLTEPMAFITDELVALFCGIWAWRLHRNDSRHTRYWSWFFIVLGVSTMVGGFSHLFFNYTGMYLKMVTWILGGAVTFFAQLATAQILPEKYQRGFRVISLIQLIAFFVCLAIFQVFLVVIVTSVVGLFMMVAMIHIYHYVKQKEESSFWIFMGLLIILATPIIHLLQLSPHKWFNHIDLSHVILGFGLYLMYHGSRKIQRMVGLSADHS